MKKQDKKNRYPQGGVMLAFSLMVFLVLVITMTIVGLVMYFVLQRDTLDIASIETISLLCMFFLLASIVLGTIISIFIGRVFLKDADVVIGGMESLARGEYDVRVPVVKQGIQKKLAESFNILASELENTESLRADFVNDFAHEFKTPIVSLLGFAKLLKTDGLTEEERKEYLNVIEEEAERLSELSTNSLNLTRVEKQSILTGQTQFNLSEQIRNTVLLVEKKWMQKNLDLNIELEEINVFGNEEMLKQVWINLIDNAIKFSFDNKELLLSLKKVAGEVVFSITNIGNQILDSEKEKIFTRFYRSKSTVGIEGNGVGLAIVKKIVELHDGKVKVESANKKTTFTVVLPNQVAV